MYSVFGLREYWPYQLIVISLHLTVAVLLRVVMRRAGVGPWLATICAGVFVLFGPGEDNILWAFQIGFAGALVLGIVQLLLADHDGPFNRRDWAGDGPSTLWLSYPPSEVEITLPNLHLLIAAVEPGKAFRVCR